MLKKSIAVVFAIALAMTATVASAQTIAAYGDPAGTQSLLEPQLDFVGDTFSMFIVLFTEDNAAAAAYKVNIPGLGASVFLQEALWGPSGNGLVIEEATGTNVALTECVFGFFGAPILIAEYRLAPLPGWPGGEVTLEANISQGDGTSPVYVTCPAVIKNAAPGPGLNITAAVDTDATSFSSIKSLYN